MGIRGLDRELWSIRGCAIDVSIKDLVEKYGKNVIVVDGFNFYGGYLYPKFDWVCGAFRELVQEIRYFVESFERIGVKLVFYFVEGNLDEGSDSCESKTWIERRSEFIKFSQKVFTNTSQWKYHQQNVKEGRAYYHTPLNALPVVLFALRHICKCEVHLTHPGDRNDAVAYYAGNNNCLALLGQDNYYIFYHMVPRYLSIKYINLSKMTTIQYCSDVFAKHRNLEGHLYPIFIRDGSPASDQMDTLFKIASKIDECESTEVARKKIVKYLAGKKLEELFDVGTLNIENVPKSTIHSFLWQILRYKLRFGYSVAYGPLEKWNLIKWQAQELYTSGQMSRCIERILMSKRYYNDCILENFTELPPSSELYQCLREQLYSVLLFEKPEQKIQLVGGESISDTSDDSEHSESDGSETSGHLEHVPGPAHIWEKKLLSFGHKDPDDPETSVKVILSGPPEGKKIHKDSFRLIKDWHMCQKGCSPKLIVVSPKSHSGLLQLWCRTNISSSICEEKWKLFASCISDSLQWQLLQLLPPTLIVPTVVLYYLFQVVPTKFKTRSWSFLQTWEVEVFIAQAVMLSKIDVNTLSRISIDTLNSRVVNLIAFFVYGCHQVRLLIQACGHPISEHDLCIFHYFDGKLFHSFYDRAAWRRNAKNLCDRETSATFEKMKQIIIPQSLTRY